MANIKYKGINELTKAAQAFLRAVGDKKQFAFYGGMGAGKTTFIKEICKLLSVSDVVTSPTFAIINEYQTDNSGKIFHFDFYRIKDIDEVYNLGYEDYFYSNDYCFIEWPELVEELLPDHIIKVKIEALDDESRIISIKE